MAETGVNTAEHTDAAETTQATTTDTQAQTAQQTAPPSFDDMLKQGYQAEFDRRVSKAIETARGKFTDPRVDDLQKQVDGYIRREAVLRANVDPNYEEFVIYKVTQGLKAGETFEGALAAFLEGNKQYLRQTQEGAAPRAWSQPMQPGSGRAEDGVEAAFKKLNPNLKLE